MDLAQSTQPSRPSQKWLLVGLLLLTAVVRLPGIQRPLVGNFATKNAVYAMIARNWALGRASWAYPTLDCLVGRERGLHMLELPVVAYLTGACWRTCGGSLDVWGRAISVAFSVAGVGLLWCLVRRRHGPVAATAAGVALALAPISIQYGQSFMLEASLVFFLVAAWWSSDRWRDAGRWPWLVCYTATLALLLLTKIYMVVFLLPLWWEAFGASWWGSLRSTHPTIPKIRNSKFEIRIPIWWSAATLLALLPAAAWYAHAWSAARPGAPLADRVYYSVRSSAEVHAPPHPLLRKPDFYRQMLDDLSGPVLTPLGCGLLLAALLVGAWRSYASWLAAGGLLMAALPLKFFEMNYYWMCLLPPLCVLAGLGWQALADRFSPSRAALAGVLLLALVWSARYAAKPSFVTPPEDQAVAAAGRALQSLAGPEDRVVTMHGTGIDLLYYCDRPGWAVSPDEPDLPQRLTDLRRAGARWLVLVGRPPENFRQLPWLISEKAEEHYAVYRVCQAL